ncbi:MAG: endonuclease/exonuclease/phosphatase family protein [Actinomycetota bacterium]|nr:endonuclease/exonuclease/phosphatase family protein [Actinomycetota bacterium]
MRRVLALGVIAGLGLTMLTATPSVAAGSLVFASFNVCGAKPGPTQCTNGATPWESRREKVARVIAESGADVLGLQEVTNNATAGVKTQVEDVARLIAPSGYVPISVADADNECRRPRDAAGQLAGPSPCETTALLAYKTSTVSVFPTPQGSSTGRVMLQSIAPGIDPGSANRSVEWAYLRGNNGAGPFLAISLHTDSDKGAGAEAARVAVGLALAGWVGNVNASRGMTGTPVILMADLNSYAARQPNGVQKMLTNTGWVDAFTAKIKKNVQYPTINSNPANGNNGFPVNPYMARPNKKNPKGYATRIDYIFGFGPGITMVSYEHVMYLNGRAHNPDYQASDHQMVRATIAFA